MLGQLPGAVGGLWARLGCCRMMLCQLLGRRASWCGGCTTPVWLHHCFNPGAQPRRQALAVLQVSLGMAWRPFLLFGCSTLQNNLPASGCSLSAACWVAQAALAREGWLSGRWVCGDPPGTAGNKGIWMRLGRTQLRARSAANPPKAGEGHICRGQLCDGQVTLSSACAQAGRMEQKHRGCL